MVLQHIKNLIWIKFVGDDGGKEQIHEITTTMTDTADKVNQILSDIKRTNNAEHVYRVDVNTTRLIKHLLKDLSPKISTEIFPGTPQDWLRKNVKKPTELMKYSIPNIIYFDFNIYEDSMRCSEVMLRLAEKGGFQDWKANALGYIGLIYKAQGNYPEALKRYEEALRIDEQLGDLSGKAIRLSNIGIIYNAQENYPEALKRYEEAMRIDEKLGDLSRKATFLNNIGAIYYAQGNYPEAIKRYEEALITLNRLGLSESPNAKNFKKNIEALKSKMK